MKYLVFLLLSLLTGCVALRSDVEAKLVDVASRVDKLSVHIDKVDTNVKLVGAEMATQLQNITSNSGTFSGSGFYLAIVVLGLLISVTVLAIIWMRKAANWKKIWQRLSDAVEEQGSGPITDEVKACFTEKIVKAGLKNMVVKDLAGRNYGK